MKYKQLAPLFVISYLTDIHEYYLEECVAEEYKENAETMYRELLKAYHVYSGIKIDYRKKKPSSDDVKPTPVS